MRKIAMLKASLWLACGYLTNAARVKGIIIRDWKIFSSKKETFFTKKYDYPLLAVCLADCGSFHT